MGNLPSQEAEENEGHYDFDESTKSDEWSDTEENPFDFSILLNKDALYKALAHLKAPPTELQKKITELEKWLKNLAERKEATVNQAQFVDFLWNKGVPKEEAIQAFNEADPDGEGNVDVTYLISLMKGSKGPDLMEALVPCHISPGLVDIYLTDKSASFNTDRNHSEEIIKFLRRHRVDPQKLVPSSVNQILSIFHSREQLVNGRFNLIMSRLKDGLPIVGGADEVEGEEKVTVSKCYYSISVSSNDKSVSNLTDGSVESYWQSNGAPRSHWIRIHMLPGIRLKELSVSVRSSDDSYMPRVMAVSVGDSPSLMKEVRQHTIPREHNGKYILQGILSREYSYIQISIRQCHSDGCDTRVRQIYLKGYKHKKEVEPSVMDTMATWYLGIVVSIAKATMPLATVLRDSILTQSRTHLQQLPLLSLSPPSTIRPEFLTPILTKEIDTFLHTLCLPGENFVSVDKDSLTVLFIFALATGNVNSLLDILHILLDNLVLELPVAPRLRMMTKVEKHKMNMHAMKLNLSSLLCDSQSDDSSRINCIFTNELAGRGSCFKSVNGKKVVNVVIEENNRLAMSITHIVMKVPPGEFGARAALVFILDSDEPKGMEFIENFSDFDHWTPELWKKYEHKLANHEEIDEDTFFKKEEEGSEEESEKTEAEKDKKEASTDDSQKRKNRIFPVAFLEPHKESKEADVVLDGSRTSRLILVKFLGQTNSEHVSIQCLHMRGYALSQDQLKTRAFLQKIEEKAALPSDPSFPVNGSTALVRTLIFLCRLLGDLSFIQQRRMSFSMDPENIGEGHLATANISLEKIWSLYIPLTLSSEGGILEDCSHLTLLLLQSSLPFLKSSSSTSTNDQSDQNLSIPGAILSHLCSLMDSPKTDSVVKGLAQDIIRDGVVVFFPGAKARKDYLLEMVESIVENKQQPPSWWLKFEALCKYFSQIDSNALLELPWNLDKISQLDSDKSRSILSTIMDVAATEARGIMVEGKLPRPPDLVRLLCSLQSCLLYWCRKQLQWRENREEKKTETSDEDSEKETRNSLKDYASKLLMDYTTRLLNCCGVVLQCVVILKESQESQVYLLKDTLVGHALPELLTFLGTMVSEDIAHVGLLKELQPLMVVLHTLFSKFPKLSLQLGAKELKGEEEAVLGVWVRESSHNYENNMRVNEEFVCPGADRFVVEFDNRCRTERRYDYLQFTDASGTKHTFDDTYGSDRWKTHPVFKGSKLRFHFYSDGSNNYWGYKFTIKGYGKAIPTMSWFFDIYVSACRVFGLLCSSVLSTKTVDSSLSEMKDEARKEVETLLHSDLWKTLFRGGYLVGKFLRSLSGSQTTSPMDSSLGIYLQDLAEGEEPSPLIQVCREAMQGGQFFGGELVDKTVGAVFAALIWHSESIREELSPNLKSPKATHGVLDAFITAESLRRELVEARQKLLEAKENEGDPKKRAEINEDKPLLDCHQKALFLLKFAGLSRAAQGGIDESFHRPGSPIVRRPSWGQNKSKKWPKVSSVVSTVQKIKQQVQAATAVNTSLSEKYPSFEMVLSFVRNSTLTVDRVHSLIQQRSQVARDMTIVCTLATELLTTMFSDGIIEIPLLTFLQHLLLKQRCFPMHYAVRLDGCGLELETRLRKSFQLFLQTLMNMVMIGKRKNLDNNQQEAGLVVRNILTHLLDISWQEYDYLLLRDAQLPEFLFTSAVRSSALENRKVIDKFPDEDALLARYETHMQMKGPFKDARNFHQFLESPIAREHPMFANLFVISMSHNVSNRIRVSCDGCGTRINGSWYRNIEIVEDCDLCHTCFFEGTGARPASHTSDHSFLMIDGYECDRCKMRILSHRFHSNTRTNFDLCLGCFRKEEKEGRQDSWTVYFLTTVPATAKHNKYLTREEGVSPGKDYINGIMTIVEAAMEPAFYNQTHSWLLFCSLALLMSQNLSENKPVGEESPYRHQSCHLLLNCIQHIATGLKFSIVAATDEALNKKMKQEKSIESMKATLTSSNDQEEEEAVVEPVFAADHSDNDSVTDSSDLEDEERKEENDGEGDEEDDEEDKDGDKENGKPGEDEKDGTNQNDHGDTESATQQGGHEVDVSQPQEEKAVEDKITIETAPSKLSINSHTNSQTNMSGFANKCDPVEKIFGLVFVERMLGLLASILPKELSLQPWIIQDGTVERVLADTLLPVLMEMARSPHMDKKHCLQALLVASQYMARLSIEVADRAVEVLEGSASESQRERSHGKKTVKYLLDFGTSHLKESDFTSAATVADCLLLLSKGKEWRPTINLAIGECLETSPQVVDMSRIFGLHVAAGFPKLARVGSVAVEHSSSGDLDEAKKAIISHPPGPSQATGVDVKTREPCSLKLAAVNVEDALKGCISPAKLTELLSLITSSLQLAKTSSPNQVEHCWVLALALKALAVLLQASESHETTRSLMGNSFIRSVVKLACKPTQFSTAWALSDLEVLGISCYQHPKEELSDDSQQQESTAAAGDEKEKKPGKEDSATKDSTNESVNKGHEDTSKTEGDSATAAKQEESNGDTVKTKGEVTQGEPDRKEVPDAQGANGKEEESGEKKTSVPKPTTAISQQELHQDQEEAAALGDLPNEIQEMLKIMKDAFQCSLAVLRALYENVQQNLDKFIMSSEQYYNMEESALKPPDDILEAAKKWEPSGVGGSSSETDLACFSAQEDMGVSQFLILPTDVKNMTAVAEDKAELKKSQELIAGKKKKTGNSATDKEASFKLLQEELAKLVIKKANREFMLKINRALVVLHARRVVALLLPQWPLEGPRLSSTLLGDIDSSQFFSLLDLIIRGLPLHERESILHSVIKYGEPTEIVSLALLAAPCMKEIIVAMESKEIKIPADEEETITGKVVFRHAAHIQTTFINVANLPVCLELAADQDFSQQLHTKSGTDKSEKWKKCVIPGSTVHYKVTVEKKGPACAFTLKFAGVQAGRFNSSHLFLQLLLCKERKLASSLPLNQFWPSLIGAACQLTGEKRLKVVALLLEVLHLSSSSGLYSSEASAAAMSVPVQKVDLTLLKPLWQLYTDMARDFEEKQKSPQLKPEIVRALTELFLVVENLAQDWGVEQELMVGTLTQEALHTWLQKGITNVACISIALGLKNQASDAFIDAKKNYVPGKSTLTSDQEDTDGNSDDDSSSSPKSTLTEDSENTFGDDDDNSFDDDDDDDDW